MAVRITNWVQVFGKFTYNSLRFLVLVNGVCSNMGVDLWGFSFPNGAATKGKWNLVY